MTKTFYFLYGWVFYPLLKFAFLFLSLFNKKIRRGLQMRQPGPEGRLPWLSGEECTRPIWIHCASGEFEYAKPVITRLKIRKPECRILVTYFSPTMATQIEKFPGVDVSCPLPWDRPSSLGPFLKFHEPRCLLIARTDTWPEMLRQGRRHGVPSLLFSATLSPQSGRARGFGRIISKIVFHCLNEIFVVTEDDLEVFADLGFRRKTRVAGDTRYDQVRARLDHPKPLREESLPPADLPVLVAGSTWSEDEDQLIPVMKAFRNKIRFVVVAHEPTEDHLKLLESALNKNGLTHARYKTYLPSAEYPNVLIVDQIGVLAEFYLQGRFAFVGGSFRKTVHSVMEPLAAGCVTFVGPLHFNNREALEFKSVDASGGDVKCVECVEDAKAWEKRLAHALARWTPEVPVQIRDEIKARSGRSELVVEWVLNQFV